MRHRCKTLKLGRKTQHRHLMLANMVCSLIERGRVKTTLEKARAARSLAEQMVTLAKKGTLHHRRQAVAKLRQEQPVRALFGEMAARFSKRNGGYTRITRLGRRMGDAVTMTFLEWVDQPAAAGETAPGKPAKEKKAAQAAGKS